VHIFFVTALHRKEGRHRCWGWYQKVEDAERAVLENHTDIFEMGYYDTAVIEEYPEGVLSIPLDDRRWYASTYSYVRNECLVQRIPEPVEYEDTVCFAIG
jgi:hypothetical protein